MNQEAEQGTESAAALAGDHSNVVEEHDEEGVEGEEEGPAMAQPEEGPALLTDDLRDEIVHHVILIP